MKHMVVEQICNNIGVHMDPLAGTGQYLMPMSFSGFANAPWTSFNMTVNPMIYIIYDEILTNMKFPRKEF